MTSNEPDRGHTAENAIEVSRLSFSHSGSDAPTLATISFTLAFGERVVLTGPSGAGKTTLVSLLLGLLDPTEGSIEIFGATPEQYRREFPGNLSIVPQSPKIISGSLLENIGLGLNVDEVDTSIVSDLIEKCALDNLVRELPSGVHTEIGRSAWKLSGGEIQRISLARALYSQPSVLFLDEPTDGLDAITEQTIRQTILNLSGLATVLVIAHKLSTIREAGRIIYMEGGRVAGDGSFSDLGLLNPNFRALTGGPGN